MNDQTPRWPTISENDPILFYQRHPDISLLQGSQTPTQEAESLTELKEAVEEVVYSLTVGVVSRSKNIPSELLKCTGSPDSDMLDLGHKRMAEGVDTVSRHNFT